MDLERGFCWAGTDGLDFHVGPDDFLKGSQQDFVQSPKVQIGQNRGWNKGRKNRLKSKLALLAFEDNFCWEGKNVLKVHFGPNDFPQGPQQDFVQTQMVQMGENTLWKQITQESIKTHLAQMAPGRVGDTQKKNTAKKTSKNKWK